MTYLGLEVLEKTTNAREVPTDQFARSVANLDPGLGKRRIKPRDEAPKIVRQFLWTCKNKSEIVAIKTWFNGFRGRLVPLWIPTWRPDLILSVQAASGDTTLTIEPCDYTKKCFPQNARRHIRIQFSDGTVSYFKIQASADNGTSEVITLPTTVGKSMANGSQISFMTYCRLNSDDLTLVHFTDSIAEASLEFIEVPQEAP